MPPFLLIAFLIATAALFIEVIVLIPLQFLNSFRLPGWVAWAMLAVVLAWCFGE